MHTVTMLPLIMLFSWTTTHCNSQTLNNETVSISSENVRHFFSSNITLPRAGYGLIQFEDQNTESNFVKFNNNGNSGVDTAFDNAVHEPALQFNDNNLYYDNSPEYNHNYVKFEDDKKKKKKRRRKPKQTPGINIPGIQYDGGDVANPDLATVPNHIVGAKRPDLYNGQDNLYPHFGGPFNSYSGVDLPGPQYYGQSNLYPNFGGPPPYLGSVRPGQYNGQSNLNPGFGGPYNPNSGFNRPGSHDIGETNFYQGIGLPNYRPQRRPRPSLASQALSSVTGALTSIAAHDDYQCVPRLLCEAAGGGALGNSQIVQSASRLQPLLTVLSAYSGVSTNPLFVFGRAVFLGASSRENPGSCRYAYPQCPTDTEQLVHYLNNHNGGFFRFFNAPQQGQQNLEQFYDQLSQNYGLYQPNQIPNQNGLSHLQNQQNYGYYRPSLYPAGQQQNYGVAYPYDNNNQIQFKNIKVSNDEEIKVEKRILNKPDEDLYNDFEDEQPKWTFPDTKEDNSIHNDDDYNIKDAYNHYYNRDARKGKTLKFPEQENANNLNNFNTNVREFVFPENYVNNIYNDFSSSPSFEDKFVFASKVTSLRNEDDTRTNANSFEDGAQTVYIVRGNGDPNRPEIVKLKPGQSLQ